MRCVFRFFAYGLLACSICVMAQTTRLVIDTSVNTSPVSPTLYGLMTEEINYSYDGGLYGELVRNRAFLDDPKSPVHWRPVGEAATISLESSGPGSARPMALHVRGGVGNEGYWGMPIR